MAWRESRRTVSSSCSEGQGLASIRHEARMGEYPTADNIGQGEHTTCSNEAVMVLPGEERIREISTELLQ